MLKIGDKVIIKDREGLESDYPCTFVNSMNCLHGQIATIKSVEHLDPKFLDRYRQRKFYNGDDYQYHLDIDKGEYVWHSSMFVTEKGGKEKMLCLNNPDNDFLFNLGTPVIYRDNHDEIVRLDEGDNQPYKLKSDNWAREGEVYPDFLKLFEIAEELIFYSRIFGRMIITKNDSVDYPLLAKLSDGDEFELTLDLKYFKDSILRIL